MRVIKLISLPETYLKLHRITDNSSAEICDFAKVIGIDSKVSMQVSKVVDSASFGFFEPGSKAACLLQKTDPDLKFPVTSAASNPPTEIPKLADKIFDADVRTMDGRQQQEIEHSVEEAKAVSMSMEGAIDV